MAQALSPAHIADTATGKTLVDREGHDALHIRQGHGGEVSLQRRLRNELAAIHGERGRFGGPATGPL